MTTTPTRRPTRPRDRAETSRRRGRREESENPPDGVCEYRPAGEAASRSRRPPTAKHPSSTTANATITTDQGVIEIAFDPQTAPCTVQSFVTLAQAAYFDGTSCHRLTTSDTLSVLQCGDPTGTGSGGPGYEFDDETNRRMSTSAARSRWRTPVPGRTGASSSSCTATPTCRRTTPCSAPSRRVSRCSTRSPRPVSRVAGATVRRPPLSRSQRRRDHVMTVPPGPGDPLVPGEDDVVGDPEAPPPGELPPEPAAPAAEETADAAPADAEADVAPRVPSRPRLRPRLPTPTFPRNTPGRHTRARAHGSS